MLKVKDLLKLSRSHRPVLVSNATKVGITFTSVVYDKDARGYFKKIRGTALTNLPGKKVKKFEIRVYYDKKGGYIPDFKGLRPKNYKEPKDPNASKLTIESDCWVRCSCEYFLYHCEVADTRKDAASIKYSNGALPKVTNPRYIPHICKHLIKAIQSGALLKK